MPAGISVCFARTYTCMLNSRFSSFEFLNCCCAEKDAVMDAEPKMKPALAVEEMDCCMAMSLELLVTLVILALKSIVHSSIWMKRICKSVELAAGKARNDETCVPEGRG